MIIPSSHASTQTASHLAPSCNKTTNCKLAKRLLIYVQQQWMLFSLSLVALVILSASNTGFLAIIKEVTDNGFNTNSERLHLLPFMLTGLLTIRALAGFVGNFAMRSVGRNVIARIRLDAFKHLLTLPLDFFDHHSAGNLTARITFNTEQLFNAVTKVIVSVVRDSLTILGMLAYMLYLDWQLTFIFLVFVPLMTLFLKKMTPKLRHSGHRVQHSMGEMTHVIEEAVNGQRIVKVFGGEPYEYLRFANAVQHNRQMVIKLGRVSSLNSMVIELLAAFALGWVVYYASGQFTAGEFAAFISALLMLIAPIKSLTSINEDFQIGMAAADSLFTLMDIPSQPDTGQKHAEAVSGEIEFRGITVFYATSTTPALHNINLHIRAGERIALVGRSGGGKSTLINVLPRFYELQHGQIFIDGQDIRDLPLVNLRAQFSLVSQDVVLFNDTVSRNIAYGALGNIDREQIIQAAKAAHAWEFIQHLPEGLDSMVGDRGVRLSGGQRQRLAIARALLKNAPILLLDEATSALDTESEQHVQAALETLMQNRTTIVIAHRLSTIENADRIVVMDQGRILEIGNHSTLMQSSSYYSKLYRKQFDNDT